MATALKARDQAVILREVLCLCRKRGVGEEEEGGGGKRKRDKKLLESGKCVCVSRSSSLVSYVSYLSLLVEASSDGPNPDLPISVLTGHKLLTCNTHHILFILLIFWSVSQSSVQGGD